MGTRKARRPDDWDSRQTADVAPGMENRLGRAAQFSDGIAAFVACAKERGAPDCWRTGPASRKGSLSSQNADAANPAIE